MTSITKDSADRSPIVTTADEVVSTFVVTPAMRGKYLGWRDDDKRQHVVKLVTEHTTQVLYRLTPGDVRDVCRSTAHALGELRKEDVDKVPAARDWHPTFAFTHLFHHDLEQRKELPTWQDFCDFIFRTSEGYGLFGDEIERTKKEILAEEEQAGRTEITEELVDGGLHWRVGLAYYSFLREVHSVVGLRARGIDVRVHPLADAVCRTDAWVDDMIISLWVASEPFRMGNEGRKTTVKELLRGSTRFHYLDIELDKASKYGCVHLPSERTIDLAAQKIREHKATPIVESNGG